nr:MAG TPA: hypothetical protein [Caudoviricetes sp.]
MFNSIYIRLSIYVLVVTAVFVRNGFTIGTILLTLTYLAGISYLEYSRYVTEKKDKNTQKEIEELMKRIKKEE